VDAAGLYNCFNLALSYVELDLMSFSKLTGLGCDGASVNIGRNALRGHVVLSTQA